MHSHSILVKCSETIYGLNTQLQLPIFFQISNGISPSSSEPDVEKLVADVQQLQLKELDLKGPDQQDLLSPTQTLSAPDTPSTPTQEAFLLASPGTPETPKAFDAATSPVVFPSAEKSAAIAGEVSTDDPASQGQSLQSRLSKQHT